MEWERGIPMIGRTVSIARGASGSYLVSLETRGGAIKTFAFDVQEGDIQVVTWHDDFASYMDYNLGPAAALFEAVLAFHRAQNLELPPWV